MQILDIATEENVHTGKEMESKVMEWMEKEERNKLFMSWKIFKVNIRR